MVQHHNVGAKGRIVTIFNIWLDTELVTLMLNVHLETVHTLYVFFSAVLKMCVKLYLEFAASLQQQPYLKHFSRP